MPDSLGWRANWGVVVPSTNTSVQPEFDEMRPLHRGFGEEDSAVADDPERQSHEFRESANERRAVALFELMEAASVHDPGDDLPDVAGAPEVTVDGMSGIIIFSILNQDGELPPLPTEKSIKR